MANDIIAINTNTQLTFKSPELTAFANTVFAVAQEAAITTHEYRKEICKVFDKNRIGDSTYKEDGFKGFKDFAKQVFNLNEATAYQYMAVGSLYNDPEISSISAIQTLPVASLYVIASKLDKADIMEAFENGVITAESTQNDIKEAVFNILKSKNTDSNNSKESEEFNESEETEVVETYDFNMEFTLAKPDYGNITKVLTDKTWDEVYMLLNREYGMISEIVYSKDTVIKDDKGHVTYRMRIFAEPYGSGYGRIFYKKHVSKKPNKSKAKSDNTVVMTTEEYNKMKAELEALRAKA